MELQNSIQKEEIIICKITDRRKKKVQEKNLDNNSNFHFDYAFSYNNKGFIEKFKQINSGESNDFIVCKSEDLSHSDSSNEDQIVKEIDVEDMTFHSKHKQTIEVK